MIKSESQFNNIPNKSISLKRESVTVIIPAFSREDLLLLSIKSVFNQTGNFNLDVVVVDDNSPNNLSIIVNSSFPDVRVIRNKSNVLSGISRNNGLVLARTKYVAFLDSDDMWKEDFLEMSMKTMVRKDCKASVCLTKLIFDQNINLGFRINILALTFVKSCLQLIFFYFNKGLMPKSAFYLCQLSHMVFCTEILKNIRFDPKYNSGGVDWNFVIKAMDKTSVAIVSRKLTFYRYHSKSWIQNQQKLRNKWKSYMQLFGDLKKRKINGIMIMFFRMYVNIYRRGRRVL